MGKIFDWALKIFIIISPTIYIAGVSQRVVQMLFFIFWTALLLGISLMVKPIRRVKNIWVGLFLIWNIILVCLHNPQEIPLPFFNIFFGITLYYLIANYTNDIIGVCKWFIYVMLINLPLVIMQLLKYDPLFTPDSQATFIQTIYGFFAFSNHLGLYMAVIAPIVLFFNWLWLPIILFITFAPKCLTADIVFILSIFTMATLRFKYKKIILTGIVVALALLLFLPNLSGWLLLKNHQQMSMEALKIKSEGRLKIWDRTLRIALVNPYYGHGLDTFNRQSPFFTKDISQKIWDTPQNDYLHLSYEQGIIATIILAGGFITNLLCRFWRERKDVFLQALFFSICCILISMFSQYFLYIPRLITAVVVILALFEARVYDLKKELIC